MFQYNVFNQEMLTEYKNVANFSVWFQGEKVILLGAVFNWGKNNTKKPETNTVRSKLNKHFGKSIKKETLDPTKVDFDNTIFVVDEENGEILQTWVVMG